MGIVSSTLLSLLIQSAWKCQRFLDPHYRYFEPLIAVDKSLICVSHQRPQLKHSSTNQENKIQNVKRTVHNRWLHNDYIHSHNKYLRMVKLKPRKRRPSFDATLVIGGRNKSESIANANRQVPSSTPNTLSRYENPPGIDSISLSSSSLSSSSSSSACSSEDSNDFEYPELMMPHENIDDNNRMFNEKRILSAAEEVAFRITVGRGHFTKSRKIEFLNNLRLEKKLYEYN